MFAADKSDLLHNDVDFADAWRAHNLEKGVFAAAAAAGTNGAPKLNSVPGLRVVHVDDASAYKFPRMQQEVVGNTRNAYSCHINGQVDSTSRCSVYLNHGSGGKDADQLFEQLLVHVIETSQGEM